MSRIIGFDSKHLIYFSKNVHYTRLTQLVFVLDFKAIIRVFFSFLNSFVGIVLITSFLQSTDLWYNFLDPIPEGIQIR